MADGHGGERELHGIVGRGGRFGDEAAGAEDAAHLALALRAAEELRGARPAALLRLRAAVGLGGNGEGGEETAARQTLHRLPGRGVDYLAAGRHGRRRSEFRPVSSACAIDIYPGAIALTD